MLALLHNRETKIILLLLAMLACEHPSGGAQGPEPEVTEAGREGMDRTARQGL